MKAYHLTNNSFNKFDAKHCRCTCFGAGFYFYTKKQTNHNSNYQLTCEVTIKNPMKKGECLVGADKWELVRQYLVAAVKKATGETVPFPTFGGDDITSYKYFCQFLEDWLKPDWQKVFEDFTAITGFDGYVQDDFIISLNPNNIKIIKISDNLDAKLENLMIRFPI